MKILKLPITAGYDEQADPKLVGAGYVNMENLHNLNKGALTLRNGFEQHINTNAFNSKSILDFMWWIDPDNSTVYYIAFDYANNKVLRFNSTFSTSVELESITTDLIKRANIYNYGNSVRIAKGINHNTSVLQKINRNFFDSGESFAHFAFSAELDEGETIQLVSGGLTKVYKAVDSHGANNDVTGYLEGFAGGHVRFIDDSSFNTSDYINQSIQIIDHIGITRKYKIVVSGGDTGTIESVSGGVDFVRVNINGKTSIQQIATEFVNALNDPNGHDGTLLTNITSNDGYVYINQSEIGTSGNTTITIDGDTGTAGDQASTTISKGDFTGGSTSENILVCNRSDASTDKTPTQMATELKTAIESTNGHNGSIVVTANVDSNKSTTLAGGVYMVNNNTRVGTTITVSGGFNNHCNPNPPATFSDSVGFKYEDFHYDTVNYPRLSGITTSNKTTTASGGFMPLTALARETFYKITAVYDGNQESLLNESPSIGPFTHSGGDTADNIYNFDITINETNFNPRITSLNIYRAISEDSVISDGEFSNISNIDLRSNAKEDWAVSNNAYAGRSIFSGWTTYDLSRTYLSDAQYLSPNSWSVYTSGGLQTINSYACPSASVGNDIITGASITDVKNIIDDDDSDSDLYASGTSLTDVHNISFIGNNFVAVHNDLNSNFFDSARAWICITDTPVKNLGVAGLTGNPTLGHDNGQATDNDSTQNIDFDDLMSGGLYFMKYDFETLHRCKIVVHVFKLTGGVESEAILIENTNTTNDGNHFRSKYLKIPENWDIGGGDQIRFKFSLEVEGAGDGHEGPDGPGVISNFDFKLYQIIRDGVKIWSHQNMIAVPNVNLIENSKAGDTLEVNGVNKTISTNVGGVFETDGTFSSNGGTTSVIGRNTTWNLVSETESKTTYVDKGKANLNAHYLSGSTSLNTKYTISDVLAGRTFCADISLTDAEGNKETHKDLIMFSELLKPDVIPISNFIKIDDLQGGDIKGIATLMSDLAVFSENGIFRLNVPNTDPTSWALIESEPNIGCKNQHSIKKYRNGVFFAGEDNFYYITPNFEFIALANNWLDAYKSGIQTITDNVTQTSSVTEGDVVTEIDIKNNRLLLRLPSEPYKIRILDLNAMQSEKIIWYDFVSDSFAYSGSSKHTSGFTPDLEGKIHSFFLTNTSKLYLINIVSQFGNDKTQLRDIETNNYDGGNPRLFLKTGFITFSNSNEKFLVRRLNFYCSTTNTVQIKIKFDRSSQDVGTTDADNTYDLTKTITGSGNRRSVRIGRRARGIEVLFETLTEDALPLQIKDIEFEIS